MRARGWAGAADRESSSPDPGLGTATRPRAPAIWVPGKPWLGAGRGKSGFPGPDRGDSPKLGQRGDLTRATLGTPGRDRRQHAGGDGDPRAGSGSVCLLVHPPYRGTGHDRQALARYSDAQLRRPPDPARSRSGAQPAGARGPELGGFATDCPNAILVRVCGQPRIVAGHLWLSLERNRGEGRGDAALGGRLAGSSARIAAPAQRAKEGRRSLPPAPPSSSSSSFPSDPPPRVTVPDSGVLQSVAWVCSLSNFGRN